MEKPVFTTFFTFKPYYSRRFSISAAAKVGNGRIFLISFYQKCNKSER